MIARFYKCGLVEWREDADAPKVWIVAEYSRYDFPLDFRSDRPPVTTVIKRAYVRRDYWYSEDFIGPHRDSDYHA